MSEESTPHGTGGNRKVRQELDEEQLAEAEVESDVLDADLEEYEEAPPRPPREELRADLDEADLAEADAES